MEIILLHGLGGSTTSTVKRLEEALKQALPEDTTYTRILQPHSDITLSRTVQYQRWVEEVLPQIPDGALVIGVSMGGFMALKAQELGKQINVIGISAPATIDDTLCNPEQKEATGYIQLNPVVVPHLTRMVWYSKTDDIIQGRTEYPVGVTAVEIPWLTHNTIEHVHALAYLIQSYLVKPEIESLLPEIFKFPQP